MNITYITVNWILVALPKAKLTKQPQHHDISRSVGCPPKNKGGGGNFSGYNTYHKLISFNNTLSMNSMLDKM
jgi:hypothetical protein